MNTDQIMGLALRLASFRSIPADSEVHVKGRKVQRVLTAIDVGVGELMLARELGCDAVIAHHPAGGRAQLEGYKVFSWHVDQLVDAGVPHEEAEKAVEPKLRQLEVQHHPRNYDQVPKAARMLHLPLVSIHSPCDEIGRKIMTKAVAGLGSDAKVSRVISRLRRLPEYRSARTRIEVRLGSANNKAGKVVMSHAAYTNGGYDVAKAYFKHGTGTLSYIHISDVDLAKLSSEGLANLIITGHIASDWIGLHRLVKELEKHDVETLATTDLQR